MALIKLDGSWNGKKAVTVGGKKAHEIKQLMIDMPQDLAETKLDFLKAVTCIWFGDGSRFPELPDQLTATDHLTHPGIEQGMGQQIPNGDR